MIGIPLGLLYANATEWVLHKYVLHGLGKRKGSMWSFHWSEHHRQARQNDHRDPSYERPIFDWNAQGKEACGLLLVVAPHLLLLPIAPYFVWTLVLSAIYYHRVHRRSHLNTAWARKYLRWHFDHHMGPKADANWCVSWPWFDWVMGTRERYVGTAKEARDRARRRDREQREQARLR